MLASASIDLHSYATARPRDGQKPSLGPSPFLVDYVCKGIGLAGATVTELTRVASNLTKRYDMYANLLAGNTSRR